MLGRRTRLPASLLLSILGCLVVPTACLRCERDCSGNGRCIDGGVCLCEEGWYGGDCSGNLADWKKMHKLEHNFYEHHAFKSRYVIASHHLRSCKHIVEIGGYRTPITGFLTSRHESVTVLDPYVKPAANDTLNGAPCKVRHLAMMFEDFAKHLTGEEDCFVYMGLDYYDEKNMALCDTLKHTVHKFNTVIVDYAGKYPTGAQCFKALDLPSAYERVTSVVLELENNDWGDLSNSWLPTGLTTRVLYVLRKHGSAASQAPSSPAQTAAAAAAVGLEKLEAVTVVGADGGFASPREYSGSGAPEDLALPVDSQDLLMRAGGEVRGEGNAEDAPREWSLSGITTAGQQKHSERSPLDAKLVPPAAGGDSFKAAMEAAKRREFDVAEVYWSRHEASPTGGHVHVAQLFEYAMTHYAGYRYKRAAELLVRVVEREPQDPRGYNNLALSLESAGAFAEAKEVLVQGLKAAPDHHGLNYNYAKLLMDKDQHAEAVESDGQNPDMHFYLGAALRQLGEVQVAERAFGNVLDIDPGYAFKYINTETNSDYQHFVSDERELLDRMTSKGVNCHVCLAAQGKHSPDCGREASHACALRDIVLELRALEQTLGFVADRQVDGRKVQLATGYMKHSFAYGSTFYQSWLQVFNNSELVTAVAFAKANNLFYGVLGSSIGWHSFYGALTYNMKSKGWEILCSQVDISNALADKHSLRSTGLINFACADALNADLMGVHIVVLAFSRDVNLGRVLNEKLARELQPGALVLSWSRILDAQPEFQRAAVYKVAVSWSENWGLYVYKRKADDKT